MPAINSPNRLVAAVTLALSLLASSSDVAAQVRTIQRSKGMPLARRLEPGDAVVNVVQSLEYMVEEPGTTWRDLVDRYLREGCDVVLVRAASAESRLVEEESWIATVFSGVITQWLSAGQGRDTSANGLGSTLQWSADGGEVVLGGVRVRTDNCQKFRVGHDYLLGLCEEDPSTGKKFARLGLPVVHRRVRTTDDHEELRDGLRLRDLERHVANRKKRSR